MAAGGRGATTLESSPDTRWRTLGCSVLDQLRTSGFEAATGVPKKGGLKESYSFYRIIASQVGRLSHLLS